MFASKNPLIFILHVLAVLLVALGGLWAAVAMSQPLLSFVTVMALQGMPETPVLPPPGYQDAVAQRRDDIEPDDPGYNGSGKVGFT